MKLQVDGYVPYLIEAEGYAPAVPVVAKGDQTVSSGSYDSWKPRPDGVVVRYHVNPRTSLFTPVTIQDCPVDARTLQFDRTTFLTFKDGTTQTLKDNWMSNEGHRALAKAWTGETHFYPIRSEESGCSTSCSPG